MNIQWSQPNVPKWHDWPNEPDPRKPNDRLTGKPMKSNSKVDPIQSPNNVPWIRTLIVMLKVKLLWVLFTQNSFMYITLMTHRKNDGKNTSTTFKQSGIPKMLWFSNYCLICWVSNKIDFRTKTKMVRWQHKKSLMFHIALPLCLFDVRHIRSDLFLDNFSWWYTTWWAGGSQQFEEGGHCGLWWSECEKSEFGKMEE